jgi:hypothetical protein
MLQQQKSSCTHPSVRQLPARCCCLAMCRQPWALTGVVQPVHHVLGFHMHASCKAEGVIQVTLCNVCWSWMGMLHHTKGGRCPAGVLVDLSNICWASVCMLPAGAVPRASEQQVVQLLGALAKAVKAKVAAAYKVCACL